MKAIGIDLGSRTVGLATTSGIIAMPLETARIHENCLNEALECVKLLVEKEKPDVIVMGLPYNMNGTIGPQAEYCIEFQHMLENELHLEVVMIDERMTSIMANNAMLSADLSRQKRKENVDKLAASIILQTYLDQKR